jgi:acyl carrier protein
LRFSFNRRRIEPKEEIRLRLILAHRPLAEVAGQVLQQGGEHRRAGGKHHRTSPTEQQGIIQYQQSKLPVTATGDSKYRNWTIFTLGDMTEAEIRDRVLRAIQKALPRQAVAADTLFEPLGIDSIEAMGLVFAVEEEFDVDLADLPSGGIRGVEDVVREVLALVSARNSAPT